MAGAYRREGWEALLGQALLGLLDIAQRAGWKQVRFQGLLCVWGVLCMFVGAALCVKTVGKRACRGAFVLY